MYEGQHWDPRLKKDKKCKMPDLQFAVEQPVFNKPQYPHVAPSLRGDGSTPRRYGENALLDSAVVTEANGAPAQRDAFGGGFGADNEPTTGINPSSGAQPMPTQQPYLPPTQNPNDIFSPIATPTIQ